MQVSLRASLKADLRPYWTWNTKQIFAFLQVEYATERNRLSQASIWDDILRPRVRANIDKEIWPEYLVVDQGNYLRDRPINMTLVWDVMPKVGAPPCTRSHDVK